MGTTWWNNYRGAIDAATARGFKVILAYWEDGAAAGGRITNIAAWNTMWSRVTNTYGSNTNVYFEPMNEPHGYTSANGSALPTLEQLSRDIPNSDREYVEYVAALGGEQLAERIDFAFTDGSPGRMSREEMLMHVITHGVGHRGQVSAVLLLNSVPPPSDGFTTYLHRAEPSLRRRAA